MPLLDRAFPIGQNSPLTCVFKIGFEHGSQPYDGIQSATDDVEYLTATPHRRRNKGGVQYIRSSTAGAKDVLSIPFTALKEFVAVGVVRSPTNVIDWHYYLQNGADQLKLVGLAANRSIELRRAAVTLGSSGAAKFALNDWNFIHWWGQVDNSAGFSRVRVGSWANLVLELTAQDTQAGAGSVIDQLMATGDDGPLYDDLLIFGRTLWFSDGDNFIPTGTVTGGTSGATAQVTSGIQGEGDGANSGALFVYDVVGSFLPGEPISGAGWASFAANSLGNDVASLWVPEQYVEHFTITDDIYAFWPFSTEPSHFQSLNDSASAADLIATELEGSTDMFRTEIDLAAGSVPWVVEVSAFARSDGVAADVNAVSLGLEDGSSNGNNPGVNDGRSGPGSIVSNTYERHSCIFTRNPNTGEQYTDEELALLAPRITSTEIVP